MDTTLTPTKAKKGSHRWSPCVCLCVVWLRELSHLGEVLWFYGSVSLGKECEILPILMVEWMEICTFKFWWMNCRIPCSIIISILLTSYFSKLMTPSTPVGRWRNGYRSRILRLLYVLHSLLMYINPIEHLWGYLKRRPAEHEHSPNDIYKLWEQFRRSVRRYQLRSVRSWFKSCLESSGNAEGQRRPYQVLIHYFIPKVKNLAMVLLSKNGHISTATGPTHMTQGPTHSQG